MAIRRKTVDLWERRSPLVPLHVRHLVDKGIKVFVQPSNRRANTEEEYVLFGAIIREDLSKASLIIGIKSIPLDYECLISNKTYAFFSHVANGREEDMPLLEMLLHRNIRLIDFEKMIHSSGKRVLDFCKFRGYAGMIDILHGAGLRLLVLRHYTPFMHIGPAHNYRRVGMAKQAFRDVGYSISLGNMPPSIEPLVFVFTGSENNSLGTQELFFELPYELVQPEHLPSVVRSGDTRKVYGCIVNHSDLYQRRCGGGFDSLEFEKFPERFISTFNKTIAPFASILINGIDYTSKSPRLITIPDAKALLSPKPASPWLKISPGCPALPHRLIAISDISNSPRGSIEFIKQITTIDNLFYVYDADENVSDDHFSGPGVLVCAIDKMPTQLPREATRFFGSLLLPYISQMIVSEATTSFEEYKASPIVRDAVVTSNGKLTPKYQYINDTNRRLNYRSMTHSIANGCKSILILGTGFVAPPTIEYFRKTSDIRITLASNSKAHVLKAAGRFQNVTPEVLDLSRDPEAVEKLVASHDVVVSLLPTRLHADILNMALKHKKSFAATNYTTPDIELLAKVAEEQGVSVIMEMGLDPGIDHMLAMETFDKVHAAGGKIISFKSFCGALPAPEFSNNPLRYKFSWSPEDVLSNVTKGARYLENKTIKEIREGGELMLHSHKETSLPGLDLEVYPNRDSVAYTHRYVLPDVESFTRGTYRYAGYSDAMYGLIQLGLVSQESDLNLCSDGPEVSWKSFLATKMGLPKDVFTDTLKDVVFNFLGENWSRYSCVKELGLFSDDPIQKLDTPLLTFSNHLKNCLSYGPGERDIIILINRVIVKWHDGSLEEKISRLVVYGESHGMLAMSKMVGYPVAMATKMLLDGELQRSGLILPISQDIYQPILKRLKQEGIAAMESSHEIRGK